MEKSELETRLEQLKTLKKQGYKYLARAEHGELRAYKDLPVRQINFWHAQGELPHPIDPHSFDEVIWQGKPLNITSEIKRIKKALKV